MRFLELLGNQGGIRYARTYRGGVLLAVIVIHARLG
jgi:hypothetical protein